jgi:hypothetical protein
MNKNWKTRPTSAEILGMDIIIKWANELKIMNMQIIKRSKEKI